jgi:hypothetical protein
MKYFQASPIPSLITSAIFRWRGPFRSHSGLAIVGILAVVILIFLIFQLTQGNDAPRKAGNDGAQK